MLTPSPLGFMPEVLLSTISPNHGVGPECGGIIIGGTAASTAWAANNRALYLPIYIDRPGIVTKFWTANGATASGNIDIGLYREDYTLIVAKGSTAQAGVTITQEFDVTDFGITNGTYLLGLVSSTTAATFRAMSLNYAIVGLTQQALGSTALPSTATPATAAIGIYPIAGIAFRALVA